MATLSKAPVAPVAVDSATFTQYQSTYRREVTQLADDLTSGRISVDQWRDAMLIEITYLVLVAFASGKGGLKFLTDADRAIIERKTAEQTRFIVRWADQLRQQADASGLLIVGTSIVGAALAKVWTAGQPLTVAGLVARALLYIESAKSVIQLAHGLVLGMPELPVYPGELSECLFNCRCSWSIVHLGGRSWDCTWVLGSAEHCSQCIARASEFRPLRIVNGQIQPFNAAGLFV